MAKRNEILLKIPKKTKALWSKAAAAEKITLKVWITQTLNDDFPFQLKQPLTNDETLTVINFTVGYTQKAYWIYQSKLVEAKLATWIISKLNYAAHISRQMKKNGY